MTTISLSMIVKNEERFLAACLESVRGVVDEIVVVDTGSTDSTVDIAKAYGAKIGHFPWNDNFSDARNHALSMCSGDWILSLDADERLLERHRNIEQRDAGLVRRVVNSQPPEVQGMFLTCLSATPGPVDESPVLRLFRRLPHIRYEGKLHEEVGMTIQRAGGALGMTEIAIIHDGYQASIVEERGKWDRNIRNLLVEVEERPSGFSWYNLGHSYLVVGQESHRKADLMSKILAEGLPTQDAIDQQRTYANEMLRKAQEPFAKSIGTSGPANLYWTRLVVEAQMSGLILGGVGSNPRMPIDPVIAYGAHPDPLTRLAA